MTKERTVLSLFTGGGGLDLGFEQAGFSHLEAVDNDPWSVETLRKNRPDWSPIEADVRDYAPPSGLIAPDVVLAGPPCQGFSLGGNREADDPRNALYREVTRVVARVNPRVVVIENVLNLRTMRTPDTGRPYVLEFAEDLSSAGYDVRWDVFRMSHYGVPQTRRRFVFIAVHGKMPRGFAFPVPDQCEEPIGPHIYDLAQAGDNPPSLPNHDPRWDFKSRVHTSTDEPFDPSEEIVPVRISRTASDGNPIRSYHDPFPAVDTATVWGFAQGNVRAERVERDPQDVTSSTSKYANPLLWRISASRLRKMTAREFARLQTFPDYWEFVGGTAQRDILIQVGNAVPVAFARRLAGLVHRLLDAKEWGRSLEPEHGSQPELL